MSNDNGDSVSSSTLQPDCSTARMSAADSVEFLSTKRKLKDECQNLWQELQKIQSQLHDKDASAEGHSHAGGDSDMTRAQRHEVSPRDLGAGGDNPLLAITLAKEQLLQAQIDQYESRKPEGLTQSRCLQYELLTESLTDGITQLEHVMSLVVVQGQEVQDQINRETEVVKEHTEMKRVLQEKLSCQTGHTQQSETSVVRQIKHKTDTLTAYHKVLLKNMGEFIEKHFPPPTAEQLKSSRPKGSRKSFSHVWPLHQMLEVLMNKSIETPHSPYMTLEPNHWPPYIELLLRFGIAVKHPEDDQQIKLTPFHM